MHIIMQKQFTREHSTIVKGLAIILLLAYHLFENEFVNAVLEVDYRPLSQSLFLKLTGFGNICVPLFAFMTAFGISSSIFAKDGLTTKNIYDKALKRFFTLMFHFSFLYASVNLLWWYKFDYTSVYGIGKQGLLNMLLNATGLHTFAVTPSINATWWYMSLAYTLIFLVPFLALLIRKTGYSILIISLILPTIIPIEDITARYLFTVVFGVCAAYGKWPEKLSNMKCPLSLQWLASVLLLIACIIVRQHPFIQDNYLFFVDAFISFFLLYFAGVLLAGIPVLSRILHFIGKHSLNIFLLHTFFYLTLWQEYIYYFKYAGITLLLLLGVCLAYSVALEFIKAMVLKIVRLLKLQFLPKLNSNR